MISIYILLIIIIAFIIIAFILASTLTLARDFKAYKKVYDTLHLRRFYKNLFQIYSCKYEEDDDGFVWFTKSNEFCLDGEHYLLDSPFTYFSPYSLYWLIKYRKWFAENVDINKLEDY